MARFDGRTILVTGASSGIGAACAGRLLGEGAAVMGVDLNEPAAPPAGADPARWAFRALDVRDEDAVSAAIADGVERFGRLDGVVNAAGVAGGGPVHLHGTGRVAPRHRREPDRHIPRGQARRRVDAGPGADRRRARVDREHREHRGPRGDRRRQRLQRVEGGRRPRHSQPGHRLRTPRHPCQCDLSRVHRHTDGRGRFRHAGHGRRWPRRSCASTSCAGWVVPRRLPGWLPSSCRPTRRS